MNGKSVRLLQCSIQKNFLQSEPFNGKFTPMQAVISISVCHVTSFFILFLTFTKLLVFPPKKSIIQVLTELFTNSYYSLISRIKPEKKFALYNRKSGTWIVPGCPWEFFLPLTILFILFINSSSSKESSPNIFLFLPFQHLFTYSGAKYTGSESIDKKARNVYLKLWNWIDTHVAF